MPSGAPQAGAGGSSQSQDSGPSEEYSGGTAATASSSSGQSPVLGSVPEGKATGGVLPLSFKEAIDRALRNNLGLLLASDSSLAARGAKWLELSHLLPNVSAAATQSTTQIDLAAL